MIRFGERLPRCLARRRPFPAVSTTLVRPLVIIGHRPIRNIRTLSRALLVVSSRPFLMVH